MNIKLHRPVRPLKNWLQLHREDEMLVVATLCLVPIALMPLIVLAILTFGS